MMTLASIPITGSIAMPLSDVIYEDINNIVDGEISNINLTAHQLTVSVLNSGNFSFTFGTSPIDYNLSSSGIWQLTFSSNWNAITKATFLSSLSKTRIYYDTISASTTPPFSPIIKATTSSGSTVNLEISGNITCAQISNVTIGSDQTSAKTTVSFTVTGQSGMVGFCNITIPKSEVAYGLTPTIYIDGQQAPNQGYTKDASNYYVWYTTHFSTHKISIVFNTLSSSLKSTGDSSEAKSSLQQIIYGLFAAAAIVTIIVAALQLIIRGGRKPKVP